MSAPEPIMNGNCYEILGIFVLMNKEFCPLLMLYCLFVLLLSIHPDSSPLWIFCEPALVCSAGKVLWSFISPHQCHRYLFLHFSVASCYSRICFQSVLAPGTSFPAEINLVLPAFSFHWQQRAVVWHGKKTLKFAHLERTSGVLILAAFFCDLICWADCTH